jgi:hypothetical protein
MIVGDHDTGRLSCLLCFWLHCCPNCATLLNSIVIHMRLVVYSCTNNVQFIMEFTRANCLVRVPPTWLVRLTRWWLPQFPYVRVNVMVYSGTWVREWARCGFDHR